MALKNYRDLSVWQESMDFVVDVYKLISKFPSQEKYGLSSQVQRAAVSIPANIAAGYARTHRGDYLHHLSVARGSLAEVETILALAVRLGHVGREDVLALWNLAQEISKMLTSLVADLKKQGDN